MELATAVSEIWAPSNGSTHVCGHDAAPLRSTVHQAVLIFIGELLFR